MPITISSPQTNQPFGWGFLIGFNVDRGGDTQTWDYEIRLQDAEETGVQLGQCISTPFVSTPTVFVSRAFNDSAGLASFQFPTANSLQAQNQPASLRINVRVNAVVVDTQVVLVTYDPIQGQLREISRKQQTTGEGFTEDDRIVLMGMNGGLLAALVGEFGAEALQFIRGKFATDDIVQLLGVPVCGPSQLVRGTVNPFVRWIGLQWELTQRPAGIGLIEGTPDHTYSNWGQLSYLRRNTDGFLQPSESHYEDRLNGKWIWGTREPAAIDVYVLPGVCVQFYAVLVVEPTATIGEVLEELAATWSIVPSPQAV